MQYGSEFKKTHWRSYCNKLTKGGLIDCWADICGDLGSSACRSGSRLWYYYSCGQINGIKKWSIRWKSPTSRKRMIQTTNCGSIALKKRKTSAKTSKSITKDDKEEQEQEGDDDDDQSDDDDNDNSSESDGELDPTHSSKIEINPENQELINDKLDKNMNDNDKQGEDDKKTDNKTDNKTDDKTDDTTDDRKNANINNDSSNKNNSNIDGGVDVDAMGNDNKDGDNKDENNNPANNATTNSTQ